QNNGIGLGAVANDVVVTNGLFTVNLDMGQDQGMFDGNRRWLEVYVRPGNSSGSYTKLSPPQELTPVPHASYAIAARTLTLPQTITQSSNSPLIKLNNPIGTAVWAEGTNAPASVAVSNGNAPGLFAVNSSTGPALFASQTGTGPVAVFNGGNVGIGTQTP